MPWLLRHFRLCLFCLLVGHNVPLGKAEQRGPRSGGGGLRAGPITIRPPSGAEAPFWVLVVCLKISVLAFEGGFPNSGTSKRGPEHQ